MAIKKQLIDELLEGAEASEVFASEGLFAQIKKALAERILNAEMDEHLKADAGAGEGNHRNGYSAKTVLTDEGPLQLDIPRDRQGRFEPQLIAKYQRRFPGFDEKIVSMYARGMSTREIQGHLRELYGVEVSAQLISTVTDAVLEEVSVWQNRPLEGMYPLVYFDCLRVKVRDEGTVRNKALYLAIGVNSDGYKDVLGLWLEQTEGAKFWLRVMNEIHNRGVKDFLIAVVDGLKGFPEAISAVFPHTQVQTCIVHLQRYSMNFVPSKDVTELSRALRRIYTAPTEQAAQQALEEFENSALGARHPTIGGAWRRHWEHVIPFLAFPLDVRRIMYTTNQIESLNSQLRRAVRAHGHFPSDEAALKLVWLRLKQISAGWKVHPGIWHAARAQFTIMFGERLNAR
jgi:putative transposase